MNSARSLLISTLSKFPYPRVLGGTITQKTRLGGGGERGDAGLAKEKRSSRLRPQRISVN
jgi:hypothetical protein